MTTMPLETRTRDDVLLEGFLTLDTPEGFRAELTEGDIVVTPPPDGDHEDCLSLITRQVFRRSRTEMDVSGNKGLRLEMPAGLPADHLIPDLTFAPGELRLFRGAEPWMPGDGVAMVVEVTSSKPKADRTVKRHCYARGRIPLYLLVDREESAVTLFHDPEREDYRQLVTIPFGKRLALPEPFGFDLETDAFL